MKTWYGVKGLFRWYIKESGETINFEERVVLFHASNFDEALNLAVQEAEHYCIEDPSANFKIESIHNYRAYLADEELSNGSEVFSRLMDSNLPTDNFLKRYYPKSHEHKV